ncbi:hypothetical protein PQG02_27360 [Nostoc sp. UHCC 0926]|uniref:hypothetical protein n=1 Tax=unclassified Nostoc TaxID=2593658 RepID=UPI002362879E|nr:hypothetical protein [Nostoc sp. UHCC 0926]WDD35917.1 hypothetical protein PQG02_27360 [Nostoc sp. UHCC 0926]
MNQSLPQKLDRESLNQLSKKELVEIKKHLSWECFQTLDELREAVWKQLSKLTASQVKSIIRWDFILNALFVSGFS